MKLSQRLKPVEAAGLAIALIAVVVFFVYYLRPRSPRIEYVEGHTLLGQAGERFVDKQVGLQFDPPSDWSMQGRTSDPPGRHKSERMLVKYKKLVPGTPTAWLRVSVADRKNGETPRDFLRRQRPPEATWKRTKDAADRESINGHAASHATFAGLLDPNGSKPQDYVCEMVAIQTDTTFILLAGTFAVSDTAAATQFAAATRTVTFEK